jgi:hypothetical protein
MRRIAEIVRERYPCTVEYSGGGCATLYASRNERPDCPGQPAADELGWTDVAAGPGGWIPAFGGGPDARPVGYLQEFTIGYMGIVTYRATSEDTEETLAQRIVDQLAERCACPTCEGDDPVPEFNSRYCKECQDCG